MSWNPLLVSCLRPPPSVRTAKSSRSPPPDGTAEKTRRRPDPSEATDSIRPDVGRARDDLRRLLRPRPAIPFTKRLLQVFPFLVSAPTWARRRPSGEIEGAY